MKLIIIYGPPAIGKLTVATELSRITGYKVFHNHLTLDMVESVFSPKDKPFWGLVMESRLRIIEAAAKNRIKGIIYTSGYQGQPRDETIESMISIMKKCRGQIYFVHLTCDKKELFRRVKSADRKKHLKTTTVTKLKKILSKWNMTGEISSKEKNINIDNTHLTAKKVAMMIKKEYVL